MPRNQDQHTLGALKSTFTLNGSQAYGVAVIFDNGAAHNYVDGANNFSNADLSLTGVSATSAGFGGSVFTPRTFSGGLGYHLNETTGQCLETIYASDNGGSNGGMVYFNVQTGPSPVSITGISSNVSGAGGLSPPTPRSAASGPPQAARKRPTASSSPRTSPLPAPPSGAPTSPRARLPPTRT